MLMTGLIISQQNEGQWTQSTDFFLSKLSMTQIRSPLDSSLDSTFRILFTFLLPRLYSDGYRPLHQGKLAKDLKKHLYPMSLCWYNLERWVESGAMLVDIKEKCQWTNLFSQWISSSQSLFWRVPDGDPTLKKMLIEERNQLMKILSFS